MLILKLFLVPSFIAFIAIVGKFRGAAAAGMLSGFPVIAGPILWFIYLENGSAFSIQSATATIAGVSALSSFCFTYSWLCSRFSWPVTTALSFLSYGLIVLLLGGLNLGLHLSALVSIAVVILQIYFSPKNQSDALLSPSSISEIAWRMVMAFLLVILVTGFAQNLGETYSGLFSVFPIAASTIAIFSHRNFSALHAMRSLKSMKQGLISLLLFFYIVVLVAPSLGFGFAFIIAAVLAILNQAGIHLFKSKVGIKKRLL